MSFNPNDNNLHPISRNNYEEYFLLYADNELGYNERIAVEQFVKTHPDLKQELDLLLQTKLPVEQVNFEDKDVLLSTSMKLDAVDEGLLLYLDNELDENQRKVVEQKLKEDKAFQLQYRELLKTKPVSLDKIAFPYKKELYRYKTKKPIPVYWMRIAAAVVIVLGMTLFVLTNQSKPGVAIADGAEKVQPGKEVNGSNETKTEVAVNTEKKGPPEPVAIKKGQTDDAPNIVRNLKKKQQQKQIKQPPMVPPTESQPELIAGKDQKDPEQDEIAVNKKREVAPQQTINNTTVTPSSITSLNNQTTTSPVTAVHTDVVKIDNEKKSSVKGFLRKATRFIERRTNISTTNENNELLIGAVSLKL